MNQGEIPGNGVDDDGDGIVDDVVGAKFLDAPIGDPRPPADAGDPAIGHGTACAGIISAANNWGVVGIAPGCRLMSLGLLAFDSSFETDLLGERCVRALDYALDHGSRVSSWSLALFSIPTAYRDLVDEAKSRNHVIVASAGNYSNNIDYAGVRRYPAALSLESSAVIGVGAVDNKYCLAKYPDGGSSYGPTSVLLCAPGWWNVSLQMVPSWAITSPYQWFSGTSAAAPHVAGAVALLLSIHPEYTCSQVKEALAASARPVSSLSGLTITGGVLDAGELVNR